MFSVISTLIRFSLLARAVIGTHHQRSGKHSILEFLPRIKKGAASPLPGPCPSNHLNSELMAIVVIL